MRFFFKGDFCPTNCQIETVKRDRRQKKGKHTGMREEGEVEGKPKAY